DRALPRRALSRGRRRGRSPRPRSQRRRAGRSPRPRPAVAPWLGWAKPNRGASRLPVVYRRCTAKAKEAFMATWVWIVIAIGALLKAPISRVFLRSGAAARQLSRISHRVFTRVLGPGGVVRLTLGRLFWSPGRPLPRGDAVYFTYIRRELRRRLKQSLVIALGLALGIALVITVSSASAGVKNA